MRDVRCRIFEHMESLPIKYFDTHPHGDIMSVYTNDVDTLRQMISQSMPQIFNSAITIVSVLASMLVISIPLTLVTLAMVFAVMMVTKTLAGKSGKYFLAQQNDLGKENGYIEEMMKGQKVVKVFNHEKKSVEEFTELNETLFHSSYNANMFANILMPINAQMGNLSYVLCAIVGGALAIAASGFFGLSLGSLVSFLSFNRSFSMPINQVSQQFNSIVMALAGAERIFELLDEPSEEDNGYVMLVNAKRENGKLTETEERTGEWAWKHVHQATGEVEYKPLEGALVMDDVDFGYTDDKMVLHNVSLYAKPGQKIAFVGSTGAGKTTITNLINRFYDIQDGKIRYDGININKIKEIRPAPFTGYRAAGDEPVQRYHHGEYPLRQAGRDRRGGHRGCEACQCRQLYPPAARRLQHRDQGGRRQSQSGTAPDARDRQSGSRRSAGADPRRSDQLHRHPHRAHGAGQHG